MDTQSNDKTGKIAEAITKALDWSYEAALAGGPGFEGIEELARSYSKGGGDARSQAESLIRWQMGKAGAVGFVTGLPGLPFLLATVPTNLAGVIVLQLRMVGAIAVLGGYDPKDDQVRAFVKMCLAGNAAAELARDFGVQLGKKLTEQAVKNVAGKTLQAINRKVGFRLATKFGEKGLVNLGKAIPCAGGIVGGTFDAVSTKVVGAVAIKAFIHD